MITRIQLFFVLLAAILLRSWLGLNDPLTGIDDSNIYFVYVQNLINGNGFVYHSGGERVEGFTSMLWTLILSLLYLIPLIKFEFLILVTCFLITWGTLDLIFRIIFSLVQKKSLAWYGVLLLILTPGFLDWSVFALMDTCLWIFSVVYAVHLLFSDSLKASTGKKLSLLCFLLPLVRPEGLFFTFIVAGFYIFKSWWNSQGKSLHIPDLKRFFPIFFALAGVVGITIFRLNYFGYPFPNTFYAKVSMSLADNIKQAFFYFYDSLRHTSLVPYLLLIFSIVVIIFRLGWKNFFTDYRIFTLLAFIGFFTVYPFLTGGDHFKYSRFFQTAYPLIYLLFLLLAGNVEYKLSRKFLAVAGVVVLILLNGNSTDGTSFGEAGISKTIAGYFKYWKPDILRESQLQGEFDIARNGQNIGDSLNKLFAEMDRAPSVGVTAAGGIAYKYKGEIEDILGLNNLKMAHADKVKRYGVKNHGSFNKEVFFEQRPDLFLTWPDPLTKEWMVTDSSAFDFDRRMKNPEGFINRIVNNVFVDERFKSQYRFCQIEKNGLRVFTYLRVDMTEKLRAHGLLVVFY